MNDRWPIPYPPGRSRVAGVQAEPVSDAGEDAGAWAGDPRAASALRQGLDGHDLRRGQRPAARSSALRAKPTAAGNRWMGTHRPLAAARPQAAGHQHAAPRSAGPSPAPQPRRSGLPAAERRGPPPAPGSAGRRGARSAGRARRPARRAASICWRISPAPFRWRSSASCSACRPRTARNSRAGPRGSPPPAAPWASSGACSSASAR